MNTLTTTLSSCDSNNFNRIYTCLETPQTFMSEIKITSLSTRSCFKVIAKNDYIVINGNTYFFDEDYSDICTETFVDVFNEIIADSGVKVVLDYCRRIIFISTSHFYISDMSYNIRLITGLSTYTFPLLCRLEGEYYVFHVQSVGYCLSTPILYLCSNVGANSFVSSAIDSFDIQSSRILMKFNNTIAPDLPINVNGSEYSTIIQTNDLSHLIFWLVDANFHEICLLTPMYITVSVRPIPDRTPQAVVMNPFPWLEPQVQKKDVDNQS